MGFFTSQLPGAMLLVAALLSSSCTRHLFDPTVLVLNLSAPPSAILGDSVTFTLRVTNVSANEIALTLYSEADDRSFDPIVFDSDSALVWRGTAGLIAGGPGVITLMPGETRTFERSWNMRNAEGRLVAAGQYYVRGRLLGEGGRILRETKSWAPFMILPP